MFKLIGIFVVSLVLFLGYDSLSRWYVGDASPKETVTEIRKKIGEILVGDQQVSNQVSGAEIKPNDPIPSSQSNAIPLDTSEMVREMMKK